ncbi:conidial development protein fluffy [Fusarium flagelliforme]|uniref:Conidial development protein fluffy n=1 Tax=Fusarium flagelliforme TaxID=2675880 RepID=A0A395N250_9HYPO|nr:conidial development protein fluffy [Fusarium flagelliforme]
MSPPGFSALESELTARHQNAYPYLSPVDVSNIELEAFATLVPGPIGNGAMAELNAAADMTNETSIWGPASLPTTQDDFRSLDMSYWTTIPISNELATTVITAYLAENHAMFGLFDAELFLDDLLARKLNFCSAFLVNSVFSCACLWYCTIDPSLSVLSSEFLGAAETLWLAERRSDSLLNVAAIMATGVACEIQVSNIRVLELFEDAQGMAERLGLFGVERCRRNATDWQVLSAQVKRQTAQVAWGTYNWLSYPISCPPTVPIPGEDPFQVSEKQLIGKSFGALSRLWIVVQEVAAVYSLYRPASEGALPLSFVESRYQKLLRWADTLDEDLVRGEHISNQILILHNWDIPYAGGESAGNDDVDTHQSEGIDDSDLHFYLVLCITQCQQLAICCPVYVSAGRGLLGMALQVGALSIDEALALATSLQSCSSRHNAAALRGDFGDFVIDFNLAAKVPEEAKVKAVATRLGEMILLNNVTQNGGFYSL